MNMASFSAVNEKSGLPGRFTCLRHPEIFEARRIERNAPSVVALPFDRILDIFRERCSRVSQSVIWSFNLRPIYPMTRVTVEFSRYQDTERNQNCCGTKDGTY
jgi:hypothetical protein